jgi:hypothetical protein
VHETKDILKIAIDFYKDLFKRERIGSFSLEDGFWDRDDMVPPEDRVELEAPFSMEEIKSVVFS